MRVLVYFLLVGLIACSNNYQVSTINYKNLTKSQTFTLTSTCGDKVIAIKIEGYGNSTGSSVIHLMLNGEAYESETLDGEFKFKWSGDWYSEKAIIRYIANSDSITNLTLSYRMECV
ncbi:hypothetical protein AUR67_09570 [Pseudoalteromonas sp. XI10]|uniref:hypothetical protein n=1 Tax=Pseudoalteromonas sp. XI10 TaxID=1766621 RepID=UPI000733559B|nr:hypothetical protein [Pseudoalteromonas sp. XI10]KTG20805.1 hypothetical protein AUR67_09570 [Pseudoalteromonas sp. XI10]